MTVPAWAFAVVDLWLDCRRMVGQFGGQMLPCAGGYGDQPAALMDAFRFLDGCKNSEDEGG